MKLDEVKVSIGFYVYSLIVSKRVNFNFDFHVMFILQGNLSRPQRHKTYLRTCEFSEDSDQPAQSDQNFHWAYFG